MNQQKRLSMLERPLFFIARGSFTSVPKNRCRPMSCPAQWHAPGQPITGISSVCWLGSKGAPV
jgi:hypothetical protein